MPAATPYSPAHMAESSYSPGHMGGESHPSTSHPPVDPEAAASQAVELASHSQASPPSSSHHILHPQGTPQPEVLSAEAQDTSAYAWQQLVADPFALLLHLFALGLHGSDDQASPGDATTHAATNAHQAAAASPMPAELLQVTLV